MLTGRLNRQLPETLSRFWLFFRQFEDNPACINGKAEYFRADICVFCRIQQPSLIMQNSTGYTRYVL
jgi:hypothetical protein